MNTENNPLEPIAENHPVTENMPAAESDSAVWNDPVREADSAAGDDSVHENEPAAEDHSLSEQESAIENGPVSQDEPVLQREPDAGSRPAAEAIPVQQKAPPTFWERHKERVARKKEKERNKPLALKIWSWIWTILAALIIACLFRMYIGEPIRVDGTSMTNTLQDKEIVWLSKWAYNFGEMQRNDIVVCRYPNRVNEIQPGQINLSAVFAIDTYTVFIKRLVALPGDKVQIAGGHLYVNDELVPDPEFQGSVPADYGPRTLREDEYFVMGDNRRSSHDSRANDVGPISKDMIMGKVTYVVLPWANHRVPE